MQGGMFHTCRSKKIVLAGFPRPRRLFRWLCAATGSDTNGSGPVPRIVTLDENGDFVSTVTFGTSSDYSSSLVEAPDGGYVLARYSGVLTRVDENGNTLWSTPLDGGSDWWGGRSSERRTEGMLQLAIPGSSE